MLYPTRERDSSILLFASSLDRMEAARSCSDVRLEEKRPRRRPRPGEPGLWDPTLDFGAPRRPRRPGPYLLGVRGARRLAMLLPVVAASPAARGLLRGLTRPRSGHPILSWGSGGCVVFARALWLWWGEGAALWQVVTPCPEAPVEAPQMLHVLVRVGRYCLDDLGVRTDREVRHSYLQKYPRARLTPWVAARWSAQQDDTPAALPQSLELADELERALGPAWRWGRRRAPVPGLDP